MQRALSRNVFLASWVWQLASLNLFIDATATPSPVRSGSFYSDSIIPSNNDVNVQGFLRVGVRQLTECDETCCLQFQPECSEASVDSSDEGGWVQLLPFAVQIIFIIILISLSALFSGLTLGLMGLDKTGLEIVMEGDDPVNANAAKIIYPVRQDGNLLLCTLLLGNVAVNALLSILLADLTSGLVGLLSSTILIVIFGEIVPQALCSRFALIIGSKTVPLVRVIIIILYVFAKPLAMCLDKALGDELTTTYSSAEMLKLLQIHVQEKVLDKETAVAMEGALKYKDKSVKEVMSPLKNTFMLSVDEKLNFETIARIFKTGYSRIPVFEISKNNVTGLLFVKDLIFIDPEDETPIRDFVQIFGRALHTVWPDDKLGGVLRDLKQGRSHMALVRDVNNEDENQDPFYELKGIITLEDIIEEILGQEIVDETDAFVDASETVKVNRSETFEWARLRLLDAKIVDEKLSYDEAKAVMGHLKTNYSSTMLRLTDHQLLRMVSEANVTVLPSAVREVGEDVPRDLLYEKDRPTDTCTLILSGKVTVLAGKDAFRSDVSSWAVLAVSSLADTSFVPDFTAYVSGGPLRCLRFTRDHFLKAIDASCLERQMDTEKQDVPMREENNGEVMLDNSSHSEPTSKSNVVDVVQLKDSMTRKGKLMAALTISSKSRNRLPGAKSMSPTRMKDDASRSFHSFQQRRRRSMSRSVGSLSSQPELEIEK